MIRQFRVIIVAVLSAAGGLHAAPPLPPGLSDLPTASPQAPPALPPGLSGPGFDSATDEPLSNPAQAASFADVSGFWEYRYGERLRSTDLHPSTSINETRLNIDVDKVADHWTFEAAVDLIYDDLAASRDIRLESGDGWIDLRKLNLLWQPLQNMDIRVGRQVMTWGTGDLVFLNDTFPKDWRYWLGRDIEYIKAPSDAAKVSWYSTLANLDVVYAPRFDASRYISGERLSFWNPVAGELVGRDDVIAVDKPDDWFEDDEFALRLYRTYEGVELAAYASDGFYNSPAGFDPSTGNFLFPRRRTFGASVRAPLGPGIVNLEFAHWKSRDDPDGTDPFVDNSENRYLVGYEWEAMRDFTINLQYYAAQMLDRDAYLENLPVGVPRRPEVQDIITVRLTRFLLSQNLKLSWFSYYTPRNADVYIRPEVHYKIDDQWSVEVGANWFDNGDDEPYAYLGQFKYNSNVFAAIRYSFAGGI